MNGRPWSVKLSERLKLSPEVFHLRLERTDDQPVAFEPGQYACIRKELNGDMLSGYYSLASAPRADRFELCVRVTETTGPLGRFLTECKTGEAFRSDPPAGRLLLRDPLRESVFAAHGSGISPIRSMLQYLLGDGVDRARGAALTLLQGARTPQDLLYRREFEELQQRRSHFRYWPVLSRAAAAWKGRTGHVQQHLREALGGKSEDVDVYLCGCAEMVRETSRNLLAEGFDKQSLVFEDYF